MNGPVRTCVGCRGRRAQDALLRVNRRKDGAVSVDGASARSGGRGAYICVEAGCLDQAWRSGRLRRALLADGPLPDHMHDELVRRIGERRLG